MKVVKIDGIAKVEAYRNRCGDFSTVTINGFRLEQLLANELLEKGANDESKTSLCKISISIESHTEALTINGVEMPLEL